MTSGMSERELLERLAQLPREIRPQGDPWPGIAARIESPARPQRGGWLRAVAAALLVAVTAGVLFGPFGQNGAPQGAADATALSGIMASSEAEYLAAFREFIPLGESREMLPQKTVEMIESSWAEMQNTEAVLASALLENPGDAFLNRRMLELRSRQLGFLRQLATLDSSNRRLTI